MTAPRLRPDVPRLQRMLNRLRMRYDKFPRDPLCAHDPSPYEADRRTWTRTQWPGHVDADYLRYWLSNSNITDEDFQAIAEYNERDGRYSVARFARLMCFTSKTQRNKIR